MIFPEEGMSKSSYPGVHEDEQEITNLAGMGEWLL